MEGRMQFKAEGHNLLLAEMDERGGDFDASVARSGANKLPKRFVIRGAAVRITGAVLLDRADEDGARAEHLGPAYGGGEEVRIAEGNVGDGDLHPTDVDLSVHPVNEDLFTGTPVVGAPIFADGLSFGGFGNRDSGVGEGGASDATEEIDIKVQKIAEAEAFSDGAGGLQLAALGALPVAEVERVGIVVAGGKGGADGGIHASGEADDGARAGVGHTLIFYRATYSSDPSHSRAFLKREADFMEIDRNDWRFDRLDNLRGKTFRLIQYGVPSKEWDHDHCEGCWARFAEYDGPDVLHEGYAHAEPYEDKPEPEFITKCKEQGMRCVPQPAVEGTKLDWVCPECFENFRELLNFTLEP